MSLFSQNRRTNLSFADSRQVFVFLSFSSAGIQGGQIRVRNGQKGVELWTGLYEKRSKM